jgi:CheY-like chemotaxis protein
VSRNVLVCDNEAALRDLVRATLGHTYTVVEARDGSEAVELIRREQPDVVLLDLMMPKKTGARGPGGDRNRPAASASSC